MAVATAALANTQVLSIGHNEEQSEFMVANGVNSVFSYTSACVQSYTLASTLPVQIFVKNGDDINVPNVAIYDLNTLVNLINVAFLEAYNKLVAQGGTLAEAPFLVLNSTGYLTLNYSADTTQAANGILFNQALWNLAYFTASPDSTDVGFYKLLLLPSSTSTTQLSKSVYNFNQLDKILISSNTLFVAGSWFGVNTQSRIIMDIDVPTDTSGFVQGNIGNVLYFQPNFLRVFQMQSGGSPLDRIQMDILYRYRDGTTYQLYLANGEAFSVKLEFVKKF